MTPWLRLMALCIGCLFPDHTLASRAVEPAEIKQQATSARNLQQTEERTKQTSIPFDPPFFLFLSGPGNLSVTILGIKGTSTEGNDPATAFELFALLFDSQVVSHRREIHVFMVALKLPEVAVYMIFFSPIANLSLG